jgi:hypothetical protein
MAENGNRKNGEEEGVEGGRETVVYLGADLPINSLNFEELRVRIRQLAKIAFAGP